MGATSCQNVTAPVAVCLPPPPPHAPTPRVKTHMTEITPTRTMRELLFLSSVQHDGTSPCPYPLPTTPQPSECVTRAIAYRTVRCRGDEFEISRGRVTGSYPQSRDGRNGPTSPTDRGRREAEKGKA